MIFIKQCNIIRTLNTNIPSDTVQSLIHISNVFLYESGLSFFSVIIFGLFLSECEKKQILLIIIVANINFGWVAYFVLKLRKIISGAFFIILSICLFSIAVTPATSILCILVFEIGSLLFTKHIPSWLPLFLILLSNDIHVNHGPHFNNSFFNFMNWNLNSLAKDNFQRVQLIEAHNSIFNYDFISICETSLNDSVELPETLLSEYIFVPANNPANTRHGGVRLFYKNSLPVIVRNDLSFNESIVVELKFGQKIYFLLFYIEILLPTIPRLNFKPSWQILKIYTLKSKLKNLLPHFLQVISIHTHSFGGQTVIQLLKALNLKNSVPQ